MPDPDQERTGTESAAEPGAGTDQQLDSDAPEPPAENPTIVDFRKADPDAGSPTPTT